MSQRGINNDKQKVVLSPNKYPLAQAFIWTYRVMGNQSRRSTMYEDL